MLAVVCGGCAKVVRYSDVTCVVRNDTRGGELQLLVRQWTRGTFDKWIDSGDAEDAVARVDLWWIWDRRCESGDGLWSELVWSGLVWLVWSGLVWPGLA